MRNISKNIFLNYLFCSSLGWLLRSDEEIYELSPESLSLGEQFRIEQGAEVGRRAREIYPSGIFIGERDLAGAAEKTRSIMHDGKSSTVFEGTFVVDDYVAKADILRKRGRGWHLIEVKSDTNDKPELLDDLAYTIMVMTEAGCSISKASLLLISKDYRLGMADKELFKEVDHTDDGLLRAIEFRVYWDQVKAQTSGRVQPKLELRLQCKRQCSLFQDCLGKGVKNHILDIPRLNQKKFDALLELSVTCIEDIPSGFDLTANQAKVRDCVVSQKPWVGQHLKEALDEIVWPVFYLDFETVMTAIPLYADIAPYTQLPTQYSIHKCSDIGKVIAHREYLCDPKKDSRRELAENLIHHLEKHGSIVTYGSFEKTVIAGANGLSQLYPDLSDDLEDVGDRVVDLEGIIRNHFYHPEFHGSTSIKVTLPVLVPEMSYDNLEIAEGDSASAAFAYLALGRYGPEEAERVKKNLLTYCAQDTMAMVKLHERLHELKA